jgi:hypothetical protein
MAQIAIGVAFVAFAILAMLCPMALINIYYPIASMGIVQRVFVCFGSPMVGTGISLLSLFAAHPYLDPLFEAAEHTEYKLVKYRKLHKIQDKLNKASIPSLTKKLQHGGINWACIPGMQANRPEGLRQLVPLITYAKYLKGKIDIYSLLEVSADHFASEVEAKNPQANRETIGVYRSMALNFKCTMFRTKIKAAFVRAVLLNPDTPGTLSDLGSIPKFTYEDLLKYKTNNAKVDPFFKFKDRTLFPINITTVEKFGVVALSVFLKNAIAKAYPRNHQVIEI